MASEAEDAASTDSGVQLNTEAMVSGAMGLRCLVSALFIFRVSGERGKKHYVLENQVFM